MHDIPWYIWTIIVILAGTSLALGTILYIVFKAIVGAIESIARNR